MVFLEVSLAYLIILVIEYQGEERNFWSKVTLPIFLPELIESCTALFLLCEREDLD